MLFLLTGQVASQVFMEYEFGSMMLCDALWGKAGVPFPRQDPLIEVNIKPYSSHGSLTLALFRFEDRRHFESNPASHNYQICYPDAISSGKCKQEDLNRFIISNETKASFLGPILNEAVHWHNFDLEKRQINSTENSTETTSITTATSTNLPVETGSPDIHNNPASKTSYTYPVQDSGLYCVLSVRDDQEYLQDYSVSMTAHNAYGLLPAIFFPALPFFATQLAGYILIGFVWAFTSVINRRELLPIQNLVGGTIGFLIIENIVNLAFFADFNNHGYISKSMLGIMVAMNAGRNSLSFFMLLVVCLGYGVVYPSLGRSMHYAIALTIIHFIFGALYFTSSMVSKDVNSFVVFLLGLPLAVSLFVFYCWTLIGASQTIKYLESKRQSVKLQMYRKLSNILSVSVLLLMVVFVLNAINMIMRKQEYWIANQWKWRWLLLDGSLNSIYFITFTSIAYIWMPTKNNAKLGLEQLMDEDVDETTFEHMEMEVDERDEQILEWAKENLGDNPMMPTTFLTDPLVEEEGETVFEVENLN